MLHHSTRKKETFALNIEKVETKQFAQRKAIPQPNTYVTNNSTFTLILYCASVPLVRSIIILCEIFWIRNAIFFNYNVLIRKLRIKTMRSHLKVDYRILFKQVLQYPWIFIKPLIHCIGFGLRHRSTSGTGKTDTSWNFWWNGKSGAKWESCKSSQEPSWLLGAFSRLLSNQHTDSERTPNERQNESERGAQSMWTLINWNFYHQNSRNSVYKSQSL